MVTEMNIVSRLHQERMSRYKKLIAMATSEEERRGFCVDIVTQNR